MYKVVPDKVCVGSVAELEKEIERFAFRGTGFYLYKDRTILVMPKMSITTPWRNKKNWNMSEDITVLIWNRKLADTIFSQSGLIPTQLDDRP